MLIVKLPERNEPEMTAVAGRIEPALLTALPFLSFEAIVSTFVHSNTARKPDVKDESGIRQLNLFLLSGWVHTIISRKSYMHICRTDGPPLGVRVICHEL